MSLKPPCPGLNSIKKVVELTKDCAEDYLEKEHYEVMNEFVEIFDLGNGEEFSEEQEEIFDFLERVISRSLFRRERNEYTPDLSGNQFSVLQDDESDDEDNESDADDIRPAISFWGEDSEFSDSEDCEDTDYDEENNSVLPYIIYATNNLQSILSDDNGARCVYCLGHPNISEDTLTTDESTVLCPICMVDAVVPASIVPNELTLQAWHIQGFSTF